LEHHCCHARVVQTSLHQTHANELRSCPCITLRRSKPVSDQAEKKKVKHDSCRAGVAGATYSLIASALSALTPWPYRKQYARLFCACALPCSAACVYLPTRRQASRCLLTRHARAPAQLKRGRPVFLDASAIVVQVAEVYLADGIAVLGSGSK
jgi:hypothetical protein